MALLLQYEYIWKIGHFERTDYRGLDLWLMIGKPKIWEVFFYLMS